MRLGCDDVRLMRNTPPITGLNRGWTNIPDMVQQAAFDEAVKCRPGKIITLRQKARLLADNSLNVGTTETTG